MELLSSSDDDIRRAAAAISAGGLVAFPTETVYGLGGDAFSSKALAGIFEAKNRPFFDPLIIHIAGLDALDSLVKWDALSSAARKKFDILIKNFWPGPLTLILPKRSGLPDLANAGLPAAAIRFSSNLTAQKLIRFSGRAIAAPSANPFGCLSPTRAEHVVSQLGSKVDFIIEGGRTDIGLESTVFDITAEPCRILRPGGISRDEIEKSIGPVEIFSRTDIPNDTLNAAQSPGQFKNHYAPRTPLSLHTSVELAALPVSQNEGRLYFSKPPDAVPGTVRILSGTGDMKEAAANFFDILHELDSLGLTCIRAEQAPQYGLGAAINDRLRRASAR